MTSKVEDTVNIRAPIERVFDMVTDPRLSPRWNPNIVAVDEVQDPSKVGSTWRQVVMVAGRRMNVTCRVLRYEPPTYGELEVTGDQRARIWTRCQEVDGVTRLTQGIEFEPPGGILGRMIGGVATSMVRRELTLALDRQRAALQEEG